MSPWRRFARVLNLTAAAGVVIAAFKPLVDLAGRVVL